MGLAKSRSEKKDEFSLNYCKKLGVSVCGIPWVASIHIGFGGNQQLTNFKMTITGRIK